MVRGKLRQLRQDLWLAGRSSRLDVLAMSAVILIGAELDAEIEHQTARDTTIGRPKPMGARGARMADTVAAAQD
jgi:hypothetical protein